MKKLMRCIWVLLLAAALQAQAQAQTSCDNCVAATLAPPVYRSLSESSYFFSGNQGSHDAVTNFLLARYGSFYAQCSAVSVQGVSPFTSNDWSGPANNATKIDVATVTLAKGVGCGSPDSADYPANTQSFLMQRWLTASCPDTSSISYRAGRTPVCVGPPRPKVVVIDPGHGFTCPARGMAGGAVGVTDFLVYDPPAGLLREDDLTMAIAREVQRTLPTSRYRVVLTKKSANECPNFAERGRIANDEKAKVFVSIHINSARVFPFSEVPLPVPHGTSVLYSVEKSASFNLAESMARAVSFSLGVNNRGVMVDEKLAMLKPTVTEMRAVLVEAARLSGADEIKLHTAGSAARIATGIKAALDESLGN